MTRISRTVSAAVAVALLAAAGPAAAAGVVRVAPVETSTIAVEIGHKHHGHHKFKHHFKKHYVYHYGPKCFWKKEKFWTPYGWEWQKVKVCF